MAVYDPIDTLHWMLDGVRHSMHSDSILGPNGKPKKKTKAQSTEDQIRFETLCEVLWNLEGRPGSLDEYASAKAEVA